MASQGALFLFFTAVFVVTIILVPVLGATVLATSGSSDSPITVQPDSSVQITNNTTQDPLLISLQLSATGPTALWVKVSGLGTIGNPVFGDNTQNPPNYQIVSIPMGGTIVILLPNFVEPFRITPLSSGLEQGLVGATLVEGNKNLVLDSSVVSGCNYLLRMELTADSSGTSTVIDFNTSPCPPGSKGCLNPYVNGLFASGTSAGDLPCPFGTCLLIDGSKVWADTVHTGQCANSQSTWGFGEFAPSCAATTDHPREYTTYSYTHDDANSSPVLMAPYKLKLTYSDL